jgi:predicted RNase H-like HicB family nuclease
MNHHYAMQIEWSDEDDCYIVSLPDFGPYAKTHGDTYQEAAKNGEEVLDLLVESYREEGRTLPRTTSLAPGR